MFCPPFVGLFCEKIIAMLYDVIFFTHASRAVGFGHAARCAMLHQALKSSDENLTAAFVGEFDSGAKELLRQVCDPVILSDARGLIGVYDRMDDPEFPHIWSKTKMRELSGACHKVIFLAMNSFRFAIGSDLHWLQPGT